MSHTVTIDTLFLDQDCIAQAAAQAGAVVTTGSHIKLYDGTFIDGTSLQLENWKYPVGIDKQGKAYYDNFGGQWGDQAQLDVFRQTYAVLVATKQARTEGWNVTQSTRLDGTVRLSLGKWGE